MKTPFLVFLSILISTSLSAQWADWQIFQSPTLVNDYEEIGTDLWLATETGLSRMHKETLLTEFWEVQNSELPSGHIQSLTKDPDNGLWIGTYDIEIGRFENGEFEQLDVPASILEGANNNRLYFIEFGPNGNLWMGCHSGLHRYDGNAWTSWNQSNTNMPIADVWDIAFDPEGAAYFASFFIYKLENDELTDLSNDDFHLLAYGNAYLSYAGGTLWYSSPGNSVARYENDEWTIFPIQDQDYWEPHTFSSMKNICIDPEGEAWANMYNGAGLYRLVDTVWTQENNAQSLLAEGKMDYYLFDQEGRSWAFYGTKASRMDDSGNIQTASIADLTIQSNLVAKTLTLTDGSQLVLSGLHNLDRYADGEWTTFSTPIDTVIGYKNIYDMDISPDGTLWLSSSKGLLEWKNELWTWHNTSIGMPLSILRYVEAGNNGQLWGSSLNDLIHYDGANWTHYTPANSGLTGESLADIALAEDGTLWATTYEPELIRFKNGEWSVFTPANSLIPEDYWSAKLNVDGEGPLRISLGYNGYIEIDANDNWTHITPNDLPFGDMYIYQVVSDETGRLVMPVFQDGLWVKEADGSWVHFDGTNSPISIPSASGSIRHIDFNTSGSMWLSTIGGLLVYEGFQNPSSLLAPHTLLDNNLKAYPNPATSFIQFEQENRPAQAGPYQLVNLQGQTVATGIWPAGQAVLSLPIHSLPAGMYFLNVQAEEGPAVVKWQKN